jgi:hypothetical protein
MMRARWLGNGVSSTLTIGNHGLSVTVEPGDEVDLTEGQRQFLARRGHRFEDVAPPADVEDLAGAMRPRADEGPTGAEGRG